MQFRVGGFCFTGDFFPLILNLLKDERKEIAGYPERQ